MIVARQRGANASAEQSLRTQLKSRPIWIENGERRAKEIERELKDKSVIEFLPPPAPLDTPVDPLKPVLPPPAKR